MMTATAPQAVSKNINTASKEWATRPPEQRFSSLEEVKPLLDRRRAESREVMTDPAALVCAAMPDGLALYNPDRLKDAAYAPLLNHYSFGQVSALIGAPADYLRTLKPDTAAGLINFGLSKREHKGDINAYLSANGKLKIRAVTSSRYARLYDNDIVDRLLPLAGKGWRVPPARPVCTDENSDMYDTRTRPALESDCLKNRMPGLGINPGDLIAPAGVYMSDRDFFCLMVDDSRDPVSGLQRGFILRNSEVGCARFSLSMFLLNEVCGNHILWGVQSVQEVSYVHKGDARDLSRRSFDAMRDQVTRFEQLPDGSIMERIQTAKRCELGTDLESCLNTLSSMRLMKVLSEKQVESALMTFREHPEDSGKRLLTSEKVSAWDMAQGLTRNAQSAAYAADRTELEEKAGKLLDKVAM